MHEQFNTDFPDMPSFINANCKLVNMPKMPVFLLNFVATRSLGENFAFCTASTKSNTSFIETRQRLLANIVFADTRQHAQTHTYSFIKQKVDRPQPQQ